MVVGSDARRRRSSIQALANPLSGGGVSAVDTTTPALTTIKAEVGLRSAVPIPGVELAKLD